MEEIHVIKYRSILGTIHDTKESCSREEFSDLISRDVGLDRDDSYSVVDFITENAQLVNTYILRMTGD